MSNDTAAVRTHPGAIPRRRLHHELGRAHGTLLRVLAASKPAGTLLELGTGCGVGTSWLLEGMDPDSRLISIDTDAEVQQIAREELGTDPRLTLLTADAGQYLESCPLAFDLIYADAWPGKYSHFTEALALLKPGGIYIVDDMLPQPNWPEGHDTKAAALIEWLTRLPGFKVARLDWSTGIFVYVKSGL